VTAGGATFSSDCEWHWWSFSFLITLESVMSMGKMFFFNQAWFVTHKRLISFKKRSRTSPNAFGKRWKEEFLFFISGIWTIYMGVFKNSGIPKSSILIGFSIINHLFWGKTPIFGNTHLNSMEGLLFRWSLYMHPETSQFGRQMRAACADLQVGNGDTSVGAA